MTRRGGGGGGRTGATSMPGSASDNGSWLVGDSLITFPMWVGEVRISNASRTLVDL